MSASAAESAAALHSLTTAEGDLIQVAVAAAYCIKSGGADLATIVRVRHQVFGAGTPGNTAYLLEAFVVLGLCTVAVENGEPRWTLTTEEYGLALRLDARRGGL